MSVTASSIRVDVVSDVVCPWCVIGYHQLAAAARELAISLDVHWHPFELNPHMPAEGENLREHLAAKYGTTPQGSREARARLTALGAELGFTFIYTDDMCMWNTFRAHQLIDWADEQGKGHAIQLSLFRTYFTDRQNVSDIDVLAIVAGDLGMDAPMAREMLLRETRAASVRTRQQTWLQRGVRGVPAMVFDNRHMSTGAQGIDSYRAVLHRLLRERAA